MKKTILLISLLPAMYICFAQPVQTKLQEAWQQFESDEQMKHAIGSLYVINAKTGEVVFEKNAMVGLAPASTQKIITSVTAFELLGKDYRYKTVFGVMKKNGKTNIYIQPSGDPTFGSWRWEGTNEKLAMQRIVADAKAAGISKFDSVFVASNDWEGEQIPDGWIWQDIGNYYGAGASPLIWRENQYDLMLQSGNTIGDPVRIKGTEPPLYSGSFVSMASSAAKGSGDNSYIYFPMNGNKLMVRGTIPVNENNFKISGSMPDPQGQFIGTLSTAFREISKDQSSAPVIINGAFESKAIVFHNENSPSLDSIIYWFDKKSINLYGEAIVKTFAYQKKGKASTDAGVEIVRDFWKGQGLDETELNMFDGSGLSPLNRVTTHAQVTILKYAKTKEWFPYFYNALPEYNGMKMKSGTITDVKGFCGYQQSKDGNEYIFSFLVNNYSGRASVLIPKMYEVLDKLK